MEINNCKNCNCQTNGNFCSNCGHLVKLKKIDRDYVFHEIKDTLFADKGFVYTTRRMVISPGDSVRDYITEDRSRYVKPVTYLFITSLIYTLTIHFFKIDYLAQFDTSGAPALDNINRWMVENQGYAGIILGLYMAFWVKLLFRKAGYNLYEIFILMCYITGVSTLLVSVASILLSLMHVDFLLPTAYLSMIYEIWAIGQFFDKKKAKSYIKATLAYILGLLVISFIAFIGVIIEILIRQ